MMTLLSETLISVGANAKEQAIRFGLCLAIGLGAGIIALLYLRRARPLERALTDFFASVCLALLFLVCVEFVLDGKVELYGLAAFAIGAAILPAIVAKIRAKKELKSPTNNKSGSQKNSE